MSEWEPVLFASDCAPCDLCGEPLCEKCEVHYADCDCIGPTQDDEYEYSELDGVLWARPIPQEVAS